jgi:hypothetical protein
MAWNFQELEKGQRPTFLEADFANEIIKALNALGNITLEKGAADEVLVSDDGVKIIYKFPPDGWEEKEIEICEDGVAVSHTFLVRSST